MSQGAVRSGEAAAPGVVHGTGDRASPEHEHPDVHPPRAVAGPVAVPLAGLIALVLPAALDAQPDDAEPMLPHVEAALLAVSDSLCAWAGRARARGDTARVDFGDLLRPSVTARAVARCPGFATPAPMPLQGRYVRVVYRLLAFQAESARVAIEFEVDRSVMHGRAGNWSRAHWAAEVRTDDVGRWRLGRPMVRRSVSDGTTRIVTEDTAPPRARRRPP